MNAVIFNVQRFSVHDGDGIRTTVFFKGCPLRCLWCHNPESQSKEKQLMFYKNKCVGCGKCLSLCGARGVENGLKIDRTQCVLCEKCVNVCSVGANKIAGTEMTVDEIISTVKRDKVFYKDKGGLTLSGGEPSMQPSAALEIIEKAKAEGINTVIETCGFGNAEFFKKSAQLGATFYYDIKAVDREKHKALTGQYNDVIFENLDMLFSLGARVVLRLPLIPNVNDSKQDLYLLREFLSENKDKYIRAEIMKYHNLGISKANALGVKYSMSDENATDAQAESWLDMLGRDENNVVLD